MRTWRRSSKSVFEKWFAGSHRRPACAVRRLAGRNGNDSSSQWERPFRNVAQPLCGISRPNYATDFSTGSPEAVMPPLLHCRRPPNWTRSNPRCWTKPFAATLTRSAISEIELASLAATAATRPEINPGSRSCSAGSEAERIRRPAPRNAINRVVDRLGAQPGYAPARHITHVQVLIPADIAAERYGLEADGDSGSRPDVAPDFSNRP